MGLPQSSIKICSGTLLDNTYQNTIWFDNLEDQRNYFEGKVVKTFSSYSYLRRDWDIIVQATMEEALSWTYLFFKNTSNGKTYYYFINKIQYVSDGSVKLSIEMDVMQTYLFEHNLSRSFVEREHSATDEIGENLIDEGLEVGELVVNHYEIMTELNDLSILILSTLNPSETTEETKVITRATMLNGVFSGMGVYAVDKADYNNLGTILSNFDEWGYTDAIVSMWVYPSKLINTGSNEGVAKKVIATLPYTYQFSRPDEIQGYTPRNKKLFTYPYCFAYVTNNEGGSAVYHYEHFANPDSCDLRVGGSISPEGVMKCYPLSYKGANYNYDEGITLGGFPTCAWDADVYKLWLAQNQAQQGVALGVAGATIAGGVLTSLFTGGVGAMAGIGGVASGVTQIANLMAQKSDMSVQPPQARGNFSSNVNIVEGFQTFVIFNKTVDRSHAEMIDCFFDMYGYATKLVKIPNRNVRENYTYTKTVGCNVYGNLCIDDLTKIKSIYDNGITFWKQGDLIGNYGLSNKCL